MFPLQRLMIRKKNSEISDQVEDITSYTPFSLLEKKFLPIRQEGDAEAKLPIAK
jgi:hypothetical protein